MKIWRWASRWGPVAAWAGLIFFLSSIPDTRTGGGSELPELMFRKAAHLTEYGILAFLLARALSGRGWSPRRIFATGLLFCVLFAASDEIHQSFVPGRFGKVRDVALDSLGAALVLSLDARRKESALFRRETVV
ncbi:MAG: VanZ family protein [Elusimicrobia bacterium]|nr:VanZ family protein [Elusimicrobiota bacterium]